MKRRSSATGAYVPCATPLGAFDTRASGKDHLLNPKGIDMTADKPVHRTGGGETLALPDLIPDDIFTGTSLILRHGGRFLYGLRPSRVEATRQIIELTGIGGRMEEYDNTWTACVLREAQEEMACGVRVIPSCETIVIRGEHDVQRAALTGTEHPAAVVFRRYRTPPHQPWHEHNEGEGCLVVFLSELEGTPSPAMELPALIWLRPAQVVETARRDVLLRHLLAAGAELVESAPAAMPETAWVRLTDSQEALVLALGDDALGFYQELATG